ncbi:MAG: efflux RND transporter periplasmic adaptor subunit, partial [Candidatus Marinimicrobia bacterium]|nr:efflux RND transporter periplasmic adaptor subunit [Candidatus Neomarinimicrobiota bacterium]
MNKLIDLIKKYTDVILTYLKSLTKFTWIIIGIAFIGGLLIRGGGTSEPASRLAVEAHEHKSEAEWWTCSMHPQIKLPESGQCPICFMDLIPMDSGTDDVGPRELKLSPGAIELAKIATGIVGRGLARSEVLLSGKVEYDETRVKTITAWVPGRLERLYVDYTGITVTDGDHLVDIYSPELYAAQEELIQALKSVNNGSQGFAATAAQITLDAAREKMSLMGITGKQIAEIEKRGTPEDRLTIYSPLSGIVIHKNAIEGRYVKTGSPIYTIADLSRVWVILDAYESDLPWLRFGQEVEFTAEALPGESFKGRIAFIDPILNPKTRTVQIRINLLNEDYKLKPGMFIRAKVEALLDIDGQAVNNQLAGKWIGPMHPEVVKDGPGQCDVCGMDLVPAEKLGIVSVSKSDRQPLLVPVSAVLKTGKRALVYVKLPDREEPTFVSREVVLGPRAGDNYIVLSGLAVGEEVVTNGNFKIDSAMQIAAKPSMMNPEGGVAMTGHEQHGGGAAVRPVQKQPTTTTQLQKFEAGGAYQETVDQLFKAYFEAAKVLVDDDLNQAKAALFTINQVAGAVTAAKTGLSGAALEFWQKSQQDLLAATEHARHWSDFTAARQAFEQVSAIIIKLEKSFGHGGEQIYYELFCPMAFDNTGAYWLQTAKKVNNPYFGAKMLR